MLEVKLCEVGLFKLPGVVFDKNSITAELAQEMAEWSKSPQGVGYQMTPFLWSFKTESQRDWFLIRWSNVEE